MKLILHPARLDLRYTFKISRRAFDHQNHLVVELRHEGISGYGEATHNPYYPNTAIPRLISTLESLRSEIEAHTPQTPEDFWLKMKPQLSDYPFALCALDVAMHDWCARKAGLPLHAYWGLDASSKPGTSFTLSIDDPEMMIQRMEEMSWDCYKIKLGTPDDIGLIRKLREHSTASFRVDANCAWTAQETIEKSKLLRDLGVEFIEQPLKAEAWQDMQEVYKHCALPLIADESCRSEADVDRCPDHFDGINIKVMKCGGLTPALRMIRRARVLGLKVMVGCMTESTVGISAIAHLLPLLDYADMDGPLFLQKDVATGVLITREGIHYAEGAGTGVELHAS